MAQKTLEKPVADTRNAEAAKIAAARQRDLDAAISTITKTYGDGSIMRLGDARAQVKIDVIPTGSLAIVKMATTHMTATMRGAMARLRVAIMA